MLNRSAEVRDFDRLAHRIHCASGASKELMLSLVEEKRPGSPANAQAVALQRLLNDGAWTDAALLLVETELPEWKLRQLALDEGRWHCSLSRQVNLPVALDETAEGTHEVLPLAIADAFVEARALTGALSDAYLTKEISLPKAGPDGQDCCVISCDNFY